MSLSAVVVGINVIRFIIEHVFVVGHSIFRTFALLLLDAGGRLGHRLADRRLLGFEAFAVVETLSLEKVVEVFMAAEVRERRHKVTTVTLRIHWRK